MVACAGGREDWWSYPQRLGCGFLEIRRNPCRLDTDVVTPTGATFLPEGRRDASFPPLSVPGETLGHTGGNLWNCPGSSVVVVASFLEVLLGTRRFGRLGAGRTSDGAAAESHPVFLSNRRCRLCFLFVTFFFLLGMSVLFASALALRLYRVVAILI